MKGKLEKSTVRKVLNIKKIKPMYNYLVTTAEVYTTEESIMSSGLLDQEKLGKIKDVQTVISIGSNVRDVNVGDKIGLNLESFAIREYSKDSAKSSMDEFYNKVKRYDVPIIILDNQEYLFIPANAISFVIEEFEEKEEPIINSISSGRLITPSGQLLN